MGGGELKEFNPVHYKLKKMPCETETSEQNLREDSGRASQRKQPQDKI